MLHETGVGATTAENSADVAETVALAMPGPVTRRVDSSGSGSGARSEAASLASSHGKSVALEITTSADLDRVVSVDQNPAGLGFIEAEARIGIGVGVGVGVAKSADSDSNSESTRRTRGAAAGHMSGRGRSYSVPDCAANGSATSRLSAFRAALRKVALRVWEANGARGQAGEDEATGDGSQWDGKSAIPGLGSEGEQLLFGLLQWKPTDRIRIDEGGILASHPYFLSRPEAAMSEWPLP